MTEPTRRPAVGDLVRCGSLPGVFEVVSRDGSLFTLRSGHGVTCRAGVWMVRDADPGAAPIDSIDGVNRTGPPWEGASRVRSSRFSSR